MNRPSDDEAAPPTIAGGAPQNDAAFRARILDSMADGVYFVDRDRRITYWNHGAERLTGFAAREVVGSYCFDNLLDHIDGRGCQLCRGGCPLAAAIEQDRSLELGVYLRHKSGRRVPISVRATPMKNEEGEIIGAVEVFSDSTQANKTERRIGELETIAFRDPLTALPNRRHIGLKVHQAIEEAEQLGRSFGIALLDIDHFKQVNDSWGHAVGDAVLRAITEALARSLRPSDIVGRWGGDELLAIVADVSPATLEEVTERWRELVAKCSAAVGESQVRVTVSIGATMLKAREQAEAAIERADRLMYQSKGRRNRVTVG
jgi:diguanylate cyclase (GGDEF)-like protein/PAS domain S-box-containing protein